MHHDDVMHHVAALYVSGQIATCAMIDLELLYRARTGEDHEAILIDRSSFPA